MARGICEKPRYMAFLSCGAKLPMNSLNLGLESISPMLKVAITATITQPVVACPIANKAIVDSNVPTTMLVVARIKPLM